jgi:hypothetical protein
MSGDAARTSACATKKAAVVAICAVAVVWLWQFATVRYNYGGLWTALFRIRVSMPAPDYLKGEKFYVFHQGEGYDGQVYHLIAHDPWMRKGSREAIAGASFRYQRIFVPALAWTIALGRDEWVDRAYYGVILGFVFLGVYWLGLVTGRAAWGLAFLLTPAAIVSIDRMTVDIALAAMVAGFAWYVCRGVATWRIALLLACAALTRETAVLVIAGYALFLITQKKFGDALTIALSALPAGAWFIYLGRTEPSPVASYGTWIPLAGFIERWVHPVHYLGPEWKAMVAMGCDYLALAGIAVTLGMAARLAWARRWDGQTAALYCLAVAAIFIGSRGVWEEADAFGRVLTPMLLLAFVLYFGRRPWIALAPMLLVDSPIALTLWQQMSGVARGLFG